MAETIAQLEEKLIIAKGKKRADILLELGDCRSLPLDYRESRLEEARELCVSLGYEKGEFWSVFNLSHLNASKGTGKRAEHYSNRAMILAQKLNDNFLLGHAYYALGGFYHQIENNYPKAMEYSRQALLFMEESKDKNGISSVTNQLGLLCQNIGDYEQALAFHLRTLQISTELNAAVAISIVLGNIGILYHEMENFENALKYHIEALERSRELNMPYLIAAALHNIGSNYISQNKYEKALSYVLEAFEINRHEQNKDFMARNLGSIGWIYFKQGSYKEALDRLFDSLKLAEEIGETFLIASKNKNIGQVFMKMKDYKCAFTHLYKAIEQAKKTGDKTVPRDAYQILSTGFAKQDDYEKAYQSHLKHVALKGELLNEESSRKITQMSVRYEADQKEKEKEIERLKNIELKKAYQELKASQAELIVQGKLANIGKLTSEIACEIEIPVSKLKKGLLSFNNKSEEAKIWKKPGTLQELQNLSISITENGLTANNIVTGLLHLNHRDSNISNELEVKKLVNEWLTGKYKS